MSLSLLLACLWALAAGITGMLPMRYQYPPGLALLIVAPVLLAFIGYQHGLWYLLPALAGVVSMYRRPLGFFIRRAIGRKPEPPK